MALQTPEDDAEMNNMAQRVAISQADSEDEMAWSYSDSEYVQLEKEGEIFPKSDYLSSRGYTSPYIQTIMPYKPHGNTAASGIYDVDGDGVEDNKEFSNFSDELDKFTTGVFNTADDVYNTVSGDLPGHSQMEFDAK